MSFWWSCAWNSLCVNKNRVRTKCTCQYMCVYLARNSKFPNRQTVGKFRNAYTFARPLVVKLQRTLPVVLDVTPPRTIAVGANVALSCNLISGPQGVLSWERSDGVDLRSLSNVRVVGSDNVSSSLLVRDARFEHAGTYICIAADIKAATSLLVEGTSRLLGVSEILFSCSQGRSQLQGR